MITNRFWLDVSDWEKASAEKYMREAYVNIPRKIVKSQALSNFQLFRYELRKFIVDNVKKGNKKIYTVEGFDGAGKTTTTRALTDTGNVYDGNIISRVSLRKPEWDEINQPIMDLYRQEFPGSGKIVFLDRWWNNRAFVQKVLGYCTDELYEAFIESLAHDLDQLLEQWYDVMSFLLTISQETQKDRLWKRKNSIDHNFRYSSSDSEAITKYTEINAQMDIVEWEYAKSSVPFIRVSWEDKEKAIINLLKKILQDADYEKKSTELDFTPDSTIIQPTKDEIARVMASKR